MSMFGGSASTSGGGLFSKSTSTTKMYPGFSKNLYKKKLVPIGERLADSYKVDDPGGLAAKDYWRNSVSGMYLRPETNPYLGSNIDVMRREGASQFRDLSNNINTGAQNAGALYGSKNRAAQLQAAERSTQSTEDQITRILLDNYNRERGIQDTSAKSLYSAQYDPLNYAMEVGKLMRGLVSRGVSDQVDWTHAGNLTYSMGG